MNVLVTDGHERPALAITRSLGRRGLSVMVASHERRSLAGASRFCARAIVSPRPDTGQAAFERFLVETVARERVDVVMPVGDITTRSVIACQGALSAHTHVAVPPAGAFDAVTDKVRLLGLAARCGVPAPASVVVRAASEVRPILPRLEFPVVVKSFQSRVQSPDGWTGTVAHHAESPAALEALYAGTEYLQRFPSLIQHRVIGPGVGLFALFEHGRLRSVFAHRRLREKPPSGGVSVLRESVAADPALVHYTTRLLAPLGWHGVAMVEFKRSARSGTPFLIEVNGRFWGSLQLAVDAGVDFPYLTYLLARGASFNAPVTYRIGVQSRWLLGDLDHLLMRLFQPEAQQHLSADAPSRARTLLNFLRFTGRDLNYEVLQRDDLRPFIHECLSYITHLSGSAARAACRTTSTSRMRRPPAPACAPGEDSHAGALEPYHDAAPTRTGRPVRSAPGHHL